MTSDDKPGWRLSLRPEPGSKTSEAARGGGAGRMLPIQPLGRLLGRAVSRRKDEVRVAGKRVMVAGLGNYGLRGTRHSVGMAMLNHLAGKLSVADQWKTDRRCCGDVAIAKLDNVELVLMKPRRLMNVNGLCVAGAAEAYNLSTEDIYLVHDDLDKPLGKVALKLGGSARGHNGVRSCINSLSSDCMVRLRIGIGRPAGEAAVDRYVLGRFTSAEQEILPQVLEQAVEMLLEHIRQRGNGKGTSAACEGRIRAPLGTEGA
ncbi:PREDICTED: probable peptidyl-tRNA hydrolase [Gekko japonicus]|uniref:peptidyl-tRNA hydrolase n=1 Tax=Gekko japonicus TaxID=146911 RepID=A0ABM1JWQ0_GEKJA|nr:PREDICTED: probable peptidyl-tRNA hydrolase [Gekko japonicus]